MGELDLVNRDPNNINNHLNAAFEDILAEPDGTHSIGFLWKCSYHCFTIWKSLCYNLSVLFTGPCMAAYLGCEFAEMVFLQVWAITPCLRMCSMCCAPIQKLMAMMAACCITPFCDACGAILSNIKIQKA